MYNTGSSYKTSLVPFFLTDFKYTRMTFIFSVNSNDTIISFCVDGGNRYGVFSKSKRGCPSVKQPIGIAQNCLHPKTKIPVMTVILEKNLTSFLYNTLIVCVVRMDGTILLAQDKKSL